MSVANLIANDCIGFSDIAMKVTNQLQSVKSSSLSTESNRYLDYISTKENTNMICGDILPAFDIENKWNRSTQNSRYFVSRKISKQPYKIIDAPDLVDDFYLHLLDWSSSDQIATALGSSVYLWNAGTSKVNKLVQMSNKSINSSVRNLI